MIEFPESRTLAKQIGETLIGKTIWSARAATSPHAFAWYSGDPAKYPDLLVGATIDGAYAWGGQVEISAGEVRMLFCDGVNLRYHAPDAKVPEKHQLKLTFGDQSTLIGSISMYGGLWAYRDGENDNPYYLIAKEKPSPLSDAFTFDYFASLAEGKWDLSAKAFLATEQRVPGLGNGVSQDILFAARVSPRTKMKALPEGGLRTLYNAVRETLREMTEKGGRDTERDLYGNPGGYKTIMSKNGLALPCPGCCGEVRKEAYLGGSVYYCPNCQK